MSANSRECSKRKTDGENAEPEEKAFKNNVLENGSLRGMLPSSPIKEPPVIKYLKDMELIHEIAINNDFELKKVDTSENSLKSRVHEMCHKAFWDVIEERLNASPPSYGCAIQLIDDIKQILLDLLMPWQNNLKNQISEVLDLELITQKIEHEVFDINYYENYIITLMAKICAPVRDEDVAKLRQQKEVVPLFRSIMETLELMKLDMANFTINQARPLMQQHYTSLEKDNFQKYIECTREEGQDPLSRTKTWLQRNYEKLAQAQNAGSADEGGATAAATPITGPIILNTAYLELINWEDLQIYPETMCLDERRFGKLQEQIHKLRLIAGMLLVTYNTIGPSISGVAEVREQLKQNLAILLEKLNSKDEKNILEVSLCCAEQVNSVANSWLKTHGFEELDANKQKLLLGQLQDAFSAQNAVHRLMWKRTNDFIYQCILCGSVDKVKIPTGLSTVETELIALCKSFAHLVRLNFQIYHDYYKEILTMLLEGRDDISTPSSSPTKKPQSPDSDVGRSPVKS